MRLLFTCATLIFCTQASAQWWKEVTPKDFKVALPPATGSPIDLEDVRMMREWQVKRTRAQCEFANKTFEYKFEVMYLGMFTADEFKKLKPLLNNVFAFSGIVTNEFKKEFGRPYPFVAHPDIKPCVPTEYALAAYPSGHSSAGTLSACVLADLFPKRANELLAYGDLQGDMRVVMGRHYPTDVVAGKQIGQDICDKLMANDKFKKELEAVRSSLKNEIVIRN